MYKLRIRIEKDLLMISMHEACNMRIMDVFGTRAFLTNTYVEIYSDDDEC